MDMWYKRFLMTPDQGKEVRENLKREQNTGCEYEQPSLTAASVEKKLSGYNFDSANKSTKATAETNLLLPPQFVSMPKQMQHFQPVRKVFAISVISLHLALSICWHHGSQKDFV